MRPFYFFILLFLFNSKLIYCQNDITPAFGIPNMDEIIATKCPQDTSAEAEILYEKEVIEIEEATGYTYNIKTKYIGKLKIYKKSGLERGTKKITLKKRGGAEEELSDIKGRTYNLEDGKIVTTLIKPESVFKEKVNDYEIAIKIIAPNLKEGSVFEYEYTRTSPFTISEKPNTWYFQGNIPYRWSEVVFITPGWFGYKLVFQGYVPLYYHNQKDTTLRTTLDKATKSHYIVKNSPAFLDEKFITSRADCITKLDFELAAYKSPYTGEYKKVSVTWKDICKTLNDNENFGKKIKQSGFLKDIAKNFILITDTLEKVKAAFRYITNTLEWNGSFFMYTATDLKKVFENKIGTGAELNMIIVALLRKMNIEANPAIISTKGHGDIYETFPLLNKFNFVIAQARVGGKDILMDATEKFSKPNMLPMHSLSKNIFIVEKDSGRLITNTPTESFGDVKVIDYTINEETNEIKGKAQSSLGGYSALAERNYMYKKGEADEFKKLKSRNTDWDITNIKIEKKDSVYEPLDIMYDFSVNNIDINTGAIYFNPFFNFRYIKNIFYEKTRLYPIDFYTPVEDVIIVNIKIPKGYKLEEIPKPGEYSLLNKAGKFTYAVEYIDDLLKIRSHVKINRSYFSPKDYEALKQFFDIIVDKQGQQISLKKQ